MKSPPMAFEGHRSWKGIKVDASPWKPVPVLTHCLIVGRRIDYVTMASI